MEPHVFVRMFEEALDTLEHEWALLGLGFFFQVSGNGTRPLTHQTRIPVGISVVHFRQHPASKKSHLHRKEKTPPPKSYAGTSQEKKHFTGRNKHPAAIIDHA